MDYSVPIDEMLFQLEHICNVSELQRYNKYENLDFATIKTILEEASKMCSKTIAPINRLGDIMHPKKRNDEVSCPPEFLKAYQEISFGGWVGMLGSQNYGGMQLPLVITSCVNEMLGSACLSLALNPLMTQGQIEALESHASEEIKRQFLPNLMSGRWSGTMNLTEETAGSDVGELTTVAIPTDDGHYEISGQKIYISWGEHNLTENICHLVLARLPGSQKGTKGISLFLVPKYIPNEQGKIGERNCLKAISLERKMGLHGSPTAVMEYNKAKGWLVGNPNQGMSAMFTMMNNARLGVAVQGLSQSELALQKAIRYSKDRKQGRPQIKDGVGTIIDHADVRRNLLCMKALTVVSRSLCLDTAMSIDVAKQTGSNVLKNKAAFLIPIAKAFSTDNGCRVSDIGIQVHGGLGFIESSGVPQIYRDVRITSIYEGTNGIQAMDLVNRKLADGGAAGFALIEECFSTEKLCKQNNIMTLECLQEFQDAIKKLSEALTWMLKAEVLNDRYAGASQFLKAFGLILGAHYLLKAAAKRKNSDKIELAQFYVDHLLPESIASINSACRGARSLYSAQV